MTSDMEHCDDKVMEHCDDRVMEHCDDRSWSIVMTRHGAL